MSSYRPGMQVHAVPESERAVDSNGRRLPWAYEHADSEHVQKRNLEEKGPFGKSNRRRGFSRSRTAPPSRKEDLVEAENRKDIDDIFGKYTANLRARSQASDTGVGLNVNNNSSTGSNNDKGTLQNGAASEPTEVILYGYGADVQYAAIEFFERVSGGHIYEDYDRFPPSSRYSLNLSRTHASFGASFSGSTSAAASSVPATDTAYTRNNNNFFSRSSSTNNINNNNNGFNNFNNSISESALRKKNAYIGGTHWIKVTFDSARAADAACRCSPHVICGYLVHAQPYCGAGPEADTAIPAAAGNSLMNVSASPGRSSDDATTTLSQQTLQQDISPGSSTATSATATGGYTGRQPQVTNHQSSFSRNNATSAPSSNTLNGKLAISYPSLTAAGRSSASISQSSPYGLTTSSNMNTVTSPSHPQTPIRSQNHDQKEIATPLRIQGAKRAVLRPADEALLPVIPRWQQTLAKIPIVNLFLDHSHYYNTLASNSKLHDIHGKEIILGAAATSGIGGLGGAAIGAATGAASVLGAGTVGAVGAAGAVGAVGAVGAAGVVAAASTGAIASRTIPGTGTMIGSQVPRRESDGAFDWENASFYWRCWATVDVLFGTDFCGIKGEEE